MKNAKKFSIIEKSIASQMHFGFTNIGSNMQYFWATYFYFCNLSSWRPCIYPITFFHSCSNTSTIFRKKRIVSLFVIPWQKNFEKDLDRFSAELENRFFCYWENGKQTADMLQQDCAVFFTSTMSNGLCNFSIQMTKSFHLIRLSKSFLETIEIMQSSYKSCVK